jgi:hypothetical protein
MSAFYFLSRSSNTIICILNKLRTSKRLVYFLVYDFKHLLSNPLLILISRSRVESIHQVYEGLIFVHCNNFFKGVNNFFKVGMRYFKLLLASLPIYLSLVWLNELYVSLCDLIIYLLKWKVLISLIHRFNIFDKVGWLPELIKYSLIPHLWVILRHWLWALLSSTGP